MKDLIILIILIGLSVGATLFVQWGHSVASYFQWL